MWGITLLLLIFAQAGDAAKEANHWVPGAGIISALVAGGIGGGGAVALVLNYLWLKHLRERDNDLKELLEKRIDKNSLVLESVKTMIESLVRSDETNRPKPPEGRDRPSGT